MAAAGTPEAWREVPLYSQYLMLSAPEDVLTDAIGNLKTRRTQNILAEHAAEVAPCLAQCTFLPLAVLATYAACKTRKPETFVTDLFLIVALPVYCTKTSAFSHTRRRTRTFASVRGFGLVRWATLAQGNRRHTAGSWISSHPSWKATPAIFRG